MNSKIPNLREKIAQLDWVIIKKLAERARLAQRLGSLKRDQKLPVTDVRREQELKMLHQRWALQLGLDPRSVKNIFGLIIDDAKKAQKRL